MSLANTPEFAEILDRVSGWPRMQRVALARRILEIADPPGRLQRGGPSAAEVRALLQTDQPAPDDETVRRWMDEHRMEKYGR